MPERPNDSSAPESIRAAVKNLWGLSALPEERVLRAPAFRLLEDTCQSVYVDLEDSRLEPPPAIKVTLSVLGQALRNFFRWNGAPWFADSAPDHEKTAATLHRAFLRQSVLRTYLVPLDRLSLEDRTSGSTQEVTSVRFGPNQIVRLGRGELDRRVPVDALARFGARYTFPTTDLNGFCWLTTCRTEPAGSIEKRTWLDLLNTSLADLDTVRLFRSTFPTPVEDALFVLLLVLLKDPQEVPWQPFRVPWTFSFTDDLFSDAVTPPDPSALSREIVGDERGQFEVPDESETLEFGIRQHEALQERWKDLETVLARVDTDDANFHPLTKHFFVKALSEHGVDEVISNVSCLEATLQLKCERNRKALTKRYKRLLANDEADDWLTAPYQLRNHYLHSLADPHGRLTWTDLARARWTVAMGVKKYLDFAIQRPKLNREQLLKELKA